MNSRPLTISELGAQAKTDSALLLWNDPKALAATPDAEIGMKVLEQHPNYWGRISQPVQRLRDLMQREFRGIGWLSSTQLDTSKTQMERALQEGNTVIELGLMMEASARGLLPEVYKTLISLPYEIDFQRQRALLALQLKQAQHKLDVEALADVNFVNFVDHERRELLRVRQELQVKAADLQNEIARDEARTSNELAKARGEMKIGLEGTKLAAKHRIENISHITTAILKWYDQLASVRSDSALSEEIRNEKVIVIADAIKTLRGSLDAA